MRSATGGASWNDQGQILISLQNPGTAGVDSGGRWHAETGHAAEARRTRSRLAPVSRRRCALSVHGGAVGPPRRTKCTWRHWPRQTGRLLLEGIPAFAYASPDRIIYLRNGVLVAQVLDVKRAALVGAPVVLAENALPPFSASRTGATDLPHDSQQADSAGLDQARRQRIGDATPRLLHRSADLARRQAGWRSPRATLPMATTTWRSLDVATKAMRKLTVNPANDRGSGVVARRQEHCVPVNRPEAPGLVPERTRTVLAPRNWSCPRRAPCGRISGRPVACPFSMASRARWTSGTCRARICARAPWLSRPPSMTSTGPCRLMAMARRTSSNATGRWEMYLTTPRPSGTTCRSPP